MNNISKELAFVIINPYPIRKSRTGGYRALLGTYGLKAGGRQNGGGLSCIGEGVR